MTELKTVLKNLHDLRKYLEDKEWSDELVAPYINTVMKAEELLKESQPKVLTLEKALGTHNAVLLEHKSGVCIWVDGYICDDCVNAELQRFNASPLIMPISGYNKTWRCWDKNPSEERKMEVRWE